MTTMSDDGDRTCPLCAEEMDLTDQQLKPCKCGYEICVWCWHHIMEMAEKEGSEGRCPACRTAYDKQRIVGMSANCKRMVAEISAERKHKSQKPKTRSLSTIEDRKHLSSVRVVQRNLVYVMGMPFNLSDENILERKEYFGQYGKVLKVSVSRQAGVTPQQAANSNTFSVYITYAKEEEAVRCIQAVHNFVLEGQPLRACFGTTKYCYTWLRNMTCSNPDCLYLHDIGSQEDSFTKDEIISAYTRSRVPQIPSNNLLPRSGNILPPPVEDSCSSGAVSAKQLSKSSSIGTSNQVKASSIDTSGARSAGLPAAASWGLRASNCRPPGSIVTSSQNPLKHKTEVSSSSSSMVASTKQNSAWHDDAVTVSKVPEGRSLAHTDGRSKLLEPLKHANGRDHPTEVSDVLSEKAIDINHSSSSAWDDDIITAKISDGKHIMHTKDRFLSTETSRPANATPVLDASDEVRHSAWDDDTILTSDTLGERQIIHNNDFFRVSETLNPGSGLTGISASDVTSRALPVIHRDSVSCLSDKLCLQHESIVRGATAATVDTNPVNMTYSEASSHDTRGSCLDESIHASAAVNGSTNSLCSGLSSISLDNHLGIEHTNKGQQQGSVYDHQLDEKIGKLNSRLHQYYPENGVVHSTSVPDAHALGRPELPKKSLFSNTQEAIDATDGCSHTISADSDLSSSSLCKTYSNLTSNFEDSNLGDRCLSAEGAFRSMGAKSNRNDESSFLNGHKEQTPQSFVKSDRVFEYPNSGYTNNGLYSSSFNNISSIESTSNADIEEKNIVSKILSSDFDPWDNSWSSANNFAKLLGQMNKQEGPSTQSSSWMPQNTNQSRFSFARQENQVNLLGSSFTDIDQAQRQVSSKPELYGNYFGNTYPVSNFESPNAPWSGSSTIFSVSDAGVTRTKISAPPGFSVPSKAPPPGFSSQDRYDQALNPSSETQSLGSPFQNQFLVHSASNSGDVEFIDPAILAVGKGRLPLGVENTGLGSRSFHPQFSNVDNDARIQLLMQQSISASQDQRIPNHIGDRFLQLDDAYRGSNFSSQNPNISTFAQIPHQQPSHMLNSQWNGWNGLQIGNGIGNGIHEVLKNERFGLNNYFPVNEEPKFHFPSGDIYNRAFGM